MPTTVVLARWYGGWREVINTAGVATFGRKSALLSVGAIQTTQEVDRVAGKELSGSFARHRAQMSVEHYPQTVAERPYVGYIPGSTCTAPDFDGAPDEFPVRSVSITEDDNGELQVVPTIGDIIVGVDELQEHLISTTPKRLRLRTMSTGKTPPTNRPLPRPRR